MFKIYMAAPSFNINLASAHYHRHSNLSKAWRGVRCTTEHDVGRSTAACYSSPTSNLEKENTEIGSVTCKSKRLGEKMRFGGFDSDNYLVYKERFIVRSSQVGANKTATIEAIASLLQETTCNRAQSFGWSADRFPSSPSMRKHRLIWVICHVHIEIYKYPAWGEVVEIEHWSEVDGRIAARLHSIIRNLSTGEVTGRSTSKWLMMNQDTRKLHKMNDDIWQEYLAICTKSPRSTFIDKNNNRSLRKIPKLKEPADYCQLGLMPRRGDLDMNKHVNNVTYYSWLIQSIPQDILETHELEAITIEYRRECQYSDSIDSLTSPDHVEVESTLPNSNPNSEGRHQFLHLLKFSGTDKEINLARTVWRKLDICK